MRKMTHYTLVYSSDLEEFAKMVKQVLDQGYELYGELKTPSRGRIYYIREVVKYKGIE